MQFSRHIFLFIIAVSLLSCSVTKRKYFRGWYLSKNAGSRIVHTDYILKHKVDNRITVATAANDIKAIDIVLSAQPSVEPNSSFKKDLNTVRSSISFRKHHKKQEQIPKIKTERFHSGIDDGKKQEHPEYLVITILAFALAFILPALTLLAFASPLFIAYLWAFGFSFFITSLILAAYFSKKIKEKKTEGNRWPYKIILYTDLSIIIAFFSVFISLLLIPGLGFNPLTFSLFAVLLFVIGMGFAFRSIEY